jgi:light-regulated signal transduction histidine kinase (bacteriophytochrome)
MNAPLSYMASVAEIAQGLRDDPPSYAHLIRAAGRIDYLGRRLHGLGCVRHREVAACFMEAIGEIQASIDLLEPARAESLARAAAQLESAGVGLGEGTAG